MSRARSVELHPAAEHELQRAQDWYAARSAQAAFHFNDRVWNTISAIQRNAELFAPFYRDYRRAVVVKFPYLIIFRIADDVIRVLAIAHGKRKSLYWRRRQ
jgi:toxin ParE1/3/4